MKSVLKQSFAEIFDVSHLMYDLMSEFDTLEAAVNYLRDNVRGLR